MDLRSVYWVVRTASWYKTDTFRFFFKGWYLVLRPFNAGVLFEALLHVLLQPNFTYLAVSVYCPLRFYLPIFFFTEVMSQ